MNFRLIASNVRVTHTKESLAHLLESAYIHLQDFGGIQLTPFGEEPYAYRVQGIGWLHQFIVQEGSIYFDRTYHDLVCVHDLSYRETTTLTRLVETLRYKEVALRDIDQSLGFHDLLEVL